MFAVMFVHTAFAGESAFNVRHNYFSSDFASVFLNQLFRFGKPVFLLLSGYGLARKYMKRDSLPVLEFYKDRAIRVGLPFLAWSALLLWFFDRFPWDWKLSYFDNLVKSGTLLAKSLYTGEADYHLYFLSIIIQCYLFFPLFFRIKSGLLLGGLFAVQLFQSIPTNRFLDLFYIGLPAFASAHFTYWLSYFYLGVYLAHEEPAFRAFALRAKKALLPLLALAAALMIGEYVVMSYLDRDPNMYNHTNRWTVIAYSLLFWLFFAAHDDKLRGWIEKSESRSRIISELVVISFSMFLIHPSFLRKIMTVVSWHDFYVIYPALLVVTFVPVYLFHRLVRKPEALRLFVGLPAK